MSRQHTYTCDATGLEAQGRTDTDLDDAPEDADLALPLGWAEVTVRTVRANPEFEAIRTIRAGHRDGAIAKRAAEGAPPFTEAEIALIDAELEKAFPGSPEIFVEHEAHLSPKQADKLLKTLGYKGAE